MSKKGMDKALVALRESIRAAMDGSAVDCTAIAFADCPSQVTVKSGGTSAKADVAAGANTEDCLTAITTQVAVGTINSKEVIASSDKDSPIQTALGKTQRMAKRTAATCRTRDSVIRNLGTILSPEQRDLISDQYVVAIATDKAFDDAPAAPLKARVRARKTESAPAEAETVEPVNS